MKIRRTATGEYEVQTGRASYALRETRKGELIVEVRARGLVKDNIDQRTIALSPRSER